MTHYDTLNVPRTASPEDIKLAWRLLSKLHHPDRDGGDATKMAEVNRAYETLSDPDRRERYDAGMGDQAPPSAEQQLREKAIEILSAVFDAVLERHDIETTGLVRTVRTELAAAGKKFASAAVDARSAAKRLDRICAKLLRKSGGGEDIAGLLLTGKAAQHLRKAQDAEEAVKQVNAALALIGEYGDEETTPQQQSTGFLEQQQAFARLFNGMYR